MYSNQYCLTHNDSIVTAMPFVCVWGNESYLAVPSLLLSLCSGDHMMPEFKPRPPTCKTCPACRAISTLQRSLSYRHSVEQWVSAVAQPRLAALFVQVLWAQLVWAKKSPACCRRAAAAGSSTQARRCSPEQAGPHHPPSSLS